MPVEAPQSTGFPGVENWMKDLPALAKDAQPGNEKLPDNVKPPENITATEDVDSAAALAAAARVREPKPAIAPKPEQSPKPEAPPTEAKPAETTAPIATPAEEKQPRTSQEWKNFIAKRDEGFKSRDEQIKALAAEKEKLAKQIETSTQPAPEVEAIKKERDELSETLKQISIENHPRFKQYYNTQINNQIELGKKIVGAEHADKLATILNMEDNQYKEAQLSELLMELSPLQQSRLGGVVNRLTELNLERASEITKSRENFDRMQADKATEQQKVRQNMEKTFDQIVTQLRSADGNPAFQTKDGDEEWNLEVGQRINNAKELLFGNSTKPEVVIRAALNSQALPAVLKQNLALLEQVKSLEGQINKLTAAAPKGGSAESPESPGNNMPTNPRAPQSGARPMDVTAGWIKTLPALR